MAEVLSQKEIDALLNNVQGGSSETTAEGGLEKDVVPFDFRLPNRISKNQLRTIRNIHETFAEGFSSFLVSKLQTIVNINVTSVDQIYYSEYVLSVANPACLYTFDIKNTDVKGIFEVSPDLAMNLIDMLLGGNGENASKPKPITPIEQKVLNVIIDRVMQDLTKSWLIIGDYEFRTERFESDIDFAQITSQSESVLLVTFELMIGEKTFFMNLCFATFAFDTVLSKLTVQHLSKIRPGKYSGTTAQNMIRENLSSSQIPLTVEFGKTKVSLKELMTLEKGDIIKLQNKIDCDFPVKLNEKIVFYGKPGVVNKHKAIKINRKANTEKL
jgi:flagellar motor switch protein FliM